MSSPSKGLSSTRRTKPSPYNKQMPNILSMLGAFWWAGPLLACDVLTKALKSIGVAFVWMCVGVALATLFYIKQEPIYKVVYKPATDEQIAEWWFGNSNKANFKKRICNGY
ncbi:MAG TPA: hypothetical protein VFM18_15820 [Methanosarcina sp.]|nr:hypothetical protein [Methanosarcina sp.]